MNNAFTHKIDEQITLTFPQLSAAKELFSLIDSDRNQITRFLDMDQTQTWQDEREFIKTKLIGYAEGTDLLLFMMFNQQLCGCIDIHNIDTKAGKGEIGYWIHSSFSGQGIVSKSVRAISVLAFNAFELNKLKIIVDLENSASNRVAQNSGYILTSVERSDMRLREDLRDMNHYTLLKD
ncbi:GNAT family N-acetyltransferase [Enterococcus hermanniensis]|uniref:N-acetyltransferase domain-containing protein n=1 Tax=Enterococcus hermanniensis TaxID=249189 RepID=A0A1L8TLR3_9ENTE|nr:GNAT family protein [Enterococcus hermanniensis]OJG45279.1 hypothetical protein RV04_GL002327 [Enterococcus hermanniensis]